jgi:hypothetical protein
MMKRLQLVLLAAAGCLGLCGYVSGQNPMNLFKKPNIADIFKPVVGAGGLYEDQHSDGKRPPTQMEMTIVGKEMVDGQQGYWMEVGVVAGKTGGMTYSKMLVTNDFQFKKVVFQQPGQPAMEMPFDLNGKQDNQMKDEMEKWHQVGTETITVPAGTFNCAHWKKDAGVGEVWVSDKVTPIGMVKSISEGGSTMTLLKVITGASDHITGPVTKFDPQAFMNQHKKPQ